MFKGEFDWHGARFRSGDLIFFKGKCVRSRIIRLCQWNPWSHIGMVIIHGSGEPMFFESSGKPKGKDLFTGETTSGVQLTNFYKRMEGSNLAMGIRHLSNVDLDELHLGRGMAVMKWMAGRPFEKRLIELARVGLPFLPNNRTEHMESIFCSEAVAAILMAWGVLTDKHPSNYYTPKHFATGNNIELLKGHYSPMWTINAKNERAL